MLVETELCTNRFSSSYPRALFHSCHRPNLVAVVSRILTIFFEKRASLTRTVFIYLFSRNRFGLVVEFCVVNVFISNCMSRLMDLWEIWRMLDLFVRSASLCRARCLYSIVFNPRVITRTLEFLWARGISTFAALHSQSKFWHGGVVLARANRRLWCKAVFQSSFED